MHAAIVVRGGLVVLEVVRLGVLAEARVVVRGPGGLHVAQGDALNAGHETLFADEPVGVGGLLVLHALLHHDAEDVRDVLVEGAALPGVVERGRVLRHGVRELVSDDVDGVGEVAEEIVAVPVHHLLDLGVPEGVLVLLPEVHRANDVLVLVVDGLPVEDVKVEAQHVAGVVEGLVRGRVANCFLALDAYHGPGEVFLVLVVVGVVHGPVRRLGLGWCR